MAYMSQEMKKELSVGIKEVLKKYNAKGSISVNNHSTLVVTITSSPIDFGEEYKQVNIYWIENNYEGVAKEFLLELKAAMMIGNWNRSDIQSDYICVGFYIDINIGKWNKPYVQIIEEQSIAA